MYFIAAVLGVFTAFYLTGRLMVTDHDPYHRVAMYLTYLASDVAAVALAYFLLGPTFELVLFTFTFTKCLVWLIMDKHAMVHKNVILED
jgi:hypothetical protein